MTRPPSKARCRRLGDDRPADLTRASESAGIQREMAERIATEIFDAIHENVAQASRCEMASSNRMTEAQQWPKRLPALLVRRATIAIENIQVF